MSIAVTRPHYVEALPTGVRSRIVADVNGIDMHVLEAGGDEPDRPVLLLLHGFPEFAFCWRRVMPLLAAAGFRVIAPDQRGYGLWDRPPVTFADDPGECAILNLVGDMVSLIGRMGLKSVHAVIGHDFGAVVAGFAALARPDLFCRMVLVGTPFAAAPPLGAPSGPCFADDPIHDSLARLDLPRKHYQLYYAGSDANADMLECPQGVQAFLRGYYHQKSADWPGNDPVLLAGWTAEDLARMPHYYCMPAASTMAEVAARHMPVNHTACEWLTDAELALVSKDFQRAGFQASLQWYRSAADGGLQRALRLFAGKKVEVPTMFVGGRADWGTYQIPGALESMRERLAVSQVRVLVLADAGHWPQQEQPNRLVEAVMPFLLADAPLANEKIVPS